jgi:hypothetical protein
VPTLGDSIVAKQADNKYGVTVAVVVIVIAGVIGYYYYHSKKKAEEDIYDTRKIYVIDDTEMGESKFDETVPSKKNTARNSLLSTVGSFMSSSGKVVPFDDLMQPMSPLERMQQLTASASQSMYSTNSMNNSVKFSQKLDELDSSATIRTVNKKAKRLNQALMYIKPGPEANQSFKYVVTSILQSRDIRSIAAGKVGRGELADIFDKQ